MINHAELSFNEGFLKEEITPVHIPTMECGIPTFRAYDHSTESSKGGMVTTIINRILIHLTIIPGLNGFQFGIILIAKKQTNREERST